MQTKDETEQDVEYTQEGTSGGGGGGGDVEECTATKSGVIEARGGMSGHFVPRCECPWVVEFREIGGSKTACSECITDPRSLVILKPDWTVVVVPLATEEELRMAS